MWPPFASCSATGSFAYSWSGCWLWNVGPLLFNGCVKLLDIGRNWNKLSYTPIQSIPNMLNGWYVRCVCWPCKNWDVFSFQEFCTDPCNTGPCINLLQHEVMVVEEWHNNGPQDLVTVSLCIQNAIKKMHLCLLSITYAWPYNNPTATMGHLIHNIDISKPTRRHTRCLPSALYSENRDSSVKRTPLQSARRHRMWAFAHSSRLQRRTAVRSRPRQRRRAYRWASLRRFLTVCAEIIWLCKPIVAAAVRWLFSDDLGGEDAGGGGPGLVKLHVVCGCEAGWMYCQILWNAFGDGLW